MTSVEQIKGIINATVYQNNAHPRLIESLNLHDCILPTVAFNSLRFLPQLQQITIRNSHIKRLSFEEAVDLPSNTNNYGETTNEEDAGTF